MRRNPPAKWVLPSVVDPPRICFQIEVPNEPHHLAAFRGAILNLAAAYKWQDDIAHTAKQVAAVWDDIYTKIRTCETFDCGDQGISLEDMLSQQIRKNPDDPCIQQMWCIDHWEDWYDPRSCIPGTIQQPTNGTPLEDGQCRSWDVSLRGNEKWLLPPSVSAGDTIAVTVASGAWNDGGILWNCVDGSTYVGGACTTPDPADMGDPLMSVDHMRLIMSVDGVYTDAYNLIFAVPGGVTDAQVFFQPNDSSLADNSGAVSFHVEVCKQSAPPAPIAITYGYGTGVPTIYPGQYLTLSSGCCGGGGGSDWGVGVTFDQTVHVTVVSSSNFYFGPCGGHGIIGTMRVGGFGGSIVSGMYCDGSHIPTDMPPADCDCFTLDIGTATDFTVTLLIELP